MAFSMRYRKLGGTGIDVSPLCLGTMMFGAIGNADHDDCVRIIHAALDQGVNFIDTADMYGNGEAEQIVGRALRDRREDVVLATKVYFPMGSGPNRSGNSRRWIVKAVDDSLKRLGTDWIDLYQIHRTDRSTDIEETLSALNDLIRIGKVRAIGCSAFPVEDLLEAHHVAERRGLDRFRTLQPPYSVLTRGIEAHVLPLCQKLGIGTLVFSPLAWGFLSGRYRKDRTIDLASGRAALMPSRFDPSLPQNRNKLEIVERLVALADGLGCSLPALALAFVRSHPGVTSTIIGPRTMEQMTDALASMSLALDDATLDAIDEIVGPGVDTSPSDSAWAPPALSDPELRRRRYADRAAA
jgi:aryl-alcohol dehydrogenase-like predicted oxidoreductase